MLFRLRVLCSKVGARCADLSEFCWVAGLARIGRPSHRFAVPLCGWITWNTALVVALLVAGPLVFAQVATPPGLDGRPEAQPDEGSRFAVEGEEDRVREGTELTNVLGYFTSTGSRVTFIAAESGNRFAGLENLNLERISKMISKAPKQMDWEVSGEVTEYRGANYLLVRRAILKTGADIPQRVRRQR